jgi:hypothetical protein
LNQTKSLNYFCLQIPQEKVPSVQEDAPRSDRISQIDAWINMIETLLFPEVD